MILIARGLSLWYDDGRESAFVAEHADLAHRRAVLETRLDALGVDVLAAGQ
nr:hypothetical protein [Halochromatium salexigens]